MSTLSVNLVLTSQPCLVVGGGEVAARKIEKLIDVSAAVTVITPIACPTVQSFADAGAVTLLERVYQAGDVEGYFLVIAATNDPGVNEAIYQEAVARHILCNVVDDPPRCMFYFPAVSHQGSFTIAISSQGFLPYAVKRFRRILDDHIHSGDWETWWKQAGYIRDTTASLCRTSVERDRIFDRFFEKTFRITGGIDVQSLSEDEIKRLVVGEDEPPPGAHS